MTDKADERLVADTFADIDFEDVNTLYEQVEDFGSDQLSRLSPMTASINHMLAVHARRIPDPSTTVVRRCTGQQGLWITNEGHNVVSVSLVAQISPYPLDSKLGPYLDMISYNGAISVDSFRRASAKFYLTEPSEPRESSIETKKVYSKSKDRFLELLNFLQSNTTRYLDGNAREDKRLYPNRSDPIGISTWVDIHQMGHYGLVGRTMNIFQNVPSSANKIRSPLHLMNFRGKLPDPSKLREAERERNLKALEVEYPAEDVDILDRKLGHWPDPDGVIRTLAEQNDFAGVNVRVPDVYDAQGVLVHPMDYEAVFGLGCMVYVTLTFRLWDITKGSNGSAIPKPTRSCSNVIQSMRVISDEEDDFRVWLHTDAIAEKDRVIQENENRMVAEEARMKAQKEEMVRIEKSESKAKEVAAQKKRRLEDLRLQSANASNNASDETSSVRSTSSTLSSLTTERGSIRSVSPAPPTTDVIAPESPISTTSDDIISRAITPATIMEEDLQPSESPRKRRKNMHNVAPGPKGKRKAGGRRGRAKVYAPVDADTDNMEDGESSIMFTNTREIFQSSTINVDATSILASYSTRSWSFDKYWEASGEYNPSEVDEFPIHRRSQDILVDGIKRKDPRSR
ncbi:hypothetical protein BDP27DRAFT_1372207 [Rhodocollybia butyracea]|uniref:Uncharacterized protein n=1 Tax=Rhodocollybia butyracea TaxID=206335 RepID=A0A9P5P4R4_9AGAR|nr:hypothetical protein BDP27DRAFT_1374464 [Rhodocollybia butyracea]KAF9058799.1 hypothetical protein BDP27DRAFT_1372207 [Rhodocollybia butyracea]